MTQGLVDDPFKSDTKSIKKLVSTDVKQEEVKKAGLENPFKNLFKKEEKKTSDVDSLVSLYELEKYVADEPTDPLKKAVFAKDKLSKANEIYKDEEIEEGDKQKIIEKLGFNQDDIRYNVATNLDVDERAVYIAERMKGMDDKRKAQFLEDTRTKSLGGKYLGTKDVYDNLIDAGLIDKQTKDYLLSFEKELDTQSRQYKSTKTGSGKGKKKAIKNVSFEKSLKTGKTKTLKLKVPKISSYIPKDSALGKNLRARQRKKLTFKGQPLKLKV